MRFHEEIVYRSSERIACVKQLQHSIEYGFYETRYEKSVRNLEEELGKNVGMRVRGCLNRQKEKKRKRGEKRRYEIYV
jgi:hypothetical protein